MTPVVVRRAAGILEESGRFNRFQNVEVRGLCGLRVPEKSEISV